MRFDDDIDERYRKSVEDAFSTILAKGNDFHRLMMNEIIASDMLVRVQPVDEINASGITGLISTIKTNYRLATERQLRDLEAAVRAAQLASAERLAAYATAQRALGQAEENLRIREQQFDVGRAQSDDVLIAERLLAEQRATLATALYQAHTRRAALQRLMGLPIDDLVTGTRG